MTSLTFDTDASPPSDPTWRRVARAIWKVLEANGRDRARRHLLDYAHQWESTRPDLAHDLRTAGRALAA